MVKGIGSEAELGRLDIALELDSIESVEEETGKLGWIREWLTEQGEGVGADKIESEVVLELGGEIPREEIGSTLQFLF